MQKWQIQLTAENPVPVVKAFSTRLAVRRLAGGDDPGVDRVVSSQRQLVHKTNRALITLLTSNACKWNVQHCSERRLDIFFSPMQHAMLKRNGKKGMKKVERLLYKVCHSWQPISKTNYVGKVSLLHNCHFSVK